MSDVIAVKGTIPFEVTDRTIGRGSDIETADLQRTAEEPS